MPLKLRRSLWGTRESHRLYIVLSAEDWAELEKLASGQGGGLNQVIDDILHARARELQEDRIREEVADQVKAGILAARRE